MTATAQHHHVTLTPKADAVEPARAMLMRCAEQVAARKSEGGPTTWSVGFNDANGTFIIDALFASQEAVTFHQQNIGPIVKEFGPLMAAPPETVITFVFAVA